MGNSKSQMDFAIKMDKEFYYAGESVKGHLYIHAKRPSPCIRIVLQIQGIESCQFTSQDNQPSKGYKKLINSHYIVREFPPNNVLVGQYEFPFSFQFLQYLPGSFNEQKGYKAQVVYNIKAVIQPSFKNTDLLEKKYEVVIRQPQREGEKTLYGQTFAVAKSCYCLNKGVSRISCYFDNNYYFPKDECTIICEADNTKCGLDIARIQCKFIKEVTLTSLNGNYRVFKEELNTVYFSGVAAYQSYFGQRAQRQSLKLQQKDKKAGISPSTHGNYVRCEYYILVEPIFSGCFNQVDEKQFTVRVEILQPSMEYEPIIQPDNWRPSVEQPSNFFLDFQASNDLLSSMHTGKANSPNS